MSRFDPYSVPIVRLQEQQANNFANPRAGPSRYADRQGSASSPLGLTSHLSATRPAPRPSSQSATSGTTSRRSRRFGSSFSSLLPEPSLAAPKSSRKGKERAASCRQELAMGPVPAPAPPITPGNTTAYSAGEGAPRAAVMPAAVRAGQGEEVDWNMPKSQPTRQLDGAYGTATPPNLRKLAHLSLDEQRQLATTYVRETLASWEVVNANDIRALEEELCDIRWVRHGLQYEHLDIALGRIICNDGRYREGTVPTAGHPSFVTLEEAALMRGRLKEKDAPCAHIKLFCSWMRLYGEKYKESRKERKRERYLAKIVPRMIALFDAWGLTAASTMCAVMTHGLGVPLSVSSAVCVHLITSRPDFLSSPTWHSGTAGFLRRAMTADAFRQHVPAERLSARDFLLSLTLDDIATYLRSPLQPTLAEREAQPSAVFGTFVKAFPAFLDQLNSFPEEMRDQLYDLTLNDIFLHSHYHLVRDAAPRGWRFRPHVKEEGSDVSLFCAYLVIKQREEDAEKRKQEKKASAKAEKKRLGSLASFAQVKAVQAVAAAEPAKAAGSPQRGRNRARRRRNRKRRAPPPASA